MIAVPTGRSVGELLDEGAATLQAAGLGDARVSAEWLLTAVAGGGRFAAYVDPSREVSADQIAGYRALIARRATREPLQHLLGFEDFHGLRLAVTPDVLIPRPETEGLVVWALDVLRERPRSRAADIGTGSGAIACALAHRVADLAVIAVDRSDAALEVARRNFRTHAADDRVEAVAGDLVEPLRRRGVRCDLVVANPPYLPSGIIVSLPEEVSCWEPRLALDGGPDGLAVIRRIVADAPAVMTPAAWLLMEIGQDHAQSVALMMRAEGFADISTRRDPNGVERYVGGRWPGKAQGVSGRSADRARLSAAMGGQAAPSRHHAVPASDPSSGPPAVDRSAR